MPNKDDGKIIQLITGNTDKDRVLRGMTEVATISVVHIYIDSIPREAALMRKQSDAVLLKRVLEAKYKELSLETHEARIQNMPVYEIRDSGIIVPHR